MYMYHNFLIHSSADGHLGCFHVLAIVNSILWWTLGYMCLFQFWFPWCVYPAVGLLNHKNMEFLSKCWLTPQEFFHLSQGRMSLCSTGARSMRSHQEIKLQPSRPRRWATGRHLLPQPPTTPPPWDQAVTGGLQQVRFPPLHLDSE